MKTGRVRTGTDTVRSGMAALLLAGVSLAGVSLAAASGTAAAQASTQASAQEQGAYPRSADYGAVTGLPDFTGVWEPDWSALFGRDGRRPAEPQLTPSAQQHFDAFRARQEAEGVDQEAQALCRPPGMPGIMRQPYPLEFLFSPGRVTIFTETYSQARRIFTDGRALPDDPDELFNGSSVGHWHGGVLYVDSVGFSPLAQIAGGIPHSGNMRIQERIWLDDPGTLRIETIISDPLVLERPLVQNLTFKRQADWDIREYVCAENNRLVAGEGGANVDLGLDDEDDPFGPPPS